MIVCPFICSRAAYTCVPVIDKVAGVSFQYRIDFIFEIGNRTLPPFDDMLNHAQDIAFDNNDYSRIACLRRVTGSKMIGNKLIVEVLISRSILFPVSMLESYLIFIERIKIANSAFQAEGRDFRVKEGQSLLEPLYLSSTRLLHYATSEYGCSASLALDERQFCRSVQVNTFSKDNGTHAIFVDNVRFDGNEYFIVTNGFIEDQTVFVCEDIYVRKMLAMDESVEPAGDKYQSDGPEWKGCLSLFFLTFGIWLCVFY